MRTRDTPVEGSRWFVGRSDLHLHKISFLVFAFGTFGIGLVDVFPSIGIIEHIVHLLELGVFNRLDAIRDGLLVGTRITFEGVSAKVFGNHQSVATIRAKDQHV